MVEMGRQTAQEDGEREGDEELEPSGGRERRGEDRVAAHVQKLGPELAKQCQLMWADTLLHDHHK